MAAKTRKAKKKKKTAIWTDQKITKMAKAKPKLQKDQRRSQIACEYSNIHMTSMWSQTNSKKPLKSPIVKKQYMC